MRKCLPLAVIALAWATPAAAFDTPIRKPGLWEIKTTAEGESQVGQFCGDAESHKLFDWMGANPRDPRCSEPTRQMTGGAIVIESVCKIGDMTTTSRRVITGDFSSDYTVNLTSKNEAIGAIRGMLPDATTRSTIRARWLGPCKPDQKPGDIMMGGYKTSIYDFPAVRAAANFKYYLIASVVAVLVIGAFAAVFLRKHRTA
jgi:hypothetical protein